MARRALVAATLVLGLVAALVLQPAPVFTQDSGTVIAEGFNGPQGVFVADDGTIYVADSGLGGEEEVTMPEPGSGQLITGTLGSTAQVVRIEADGTQTTVASLPSLFSGTEATGAARVVELDGELYVTHGLYLADVATGDDLTPTTADVLHILEDGTTETVASVWRLEKRMNPDGTIIESHPYGMVAGPDGNLWVADAGANTLLRVEPETKVVELVATFDPVPGVFPSPTRGGEMLADPVPTGVDFDDDGNAYVSFLTGAPFVPGSAKVVKVTPDGEVSDYATNLTMLTDLRRGPDGNFYAVQFAVFTDQGPTPDSGAVIRIAEGEGSIPVIEGLSFPTSVDFNDAGDAYVAINGVGAPGSGAVVMFEGVASGDGTDAAAAATEAPAEEATAEPTEEAAEEATEEATEEPTEEAAEEADAEATEEPAEEATPEPTEEAVEEATAEPAEEAVAEATVEATEEPAEEPTEEAAEEPTEAATEEAAEEAVAEATPTPVAEEEATPAATEEPTEEAAEEAAEEATPAATEEAVEEAVEEATATPVAEEEATAEATEEAKEEAAAATSGPAIEAVDQVSDGEGVTVAKVVAAEAGWVVIHADADGKPGAVLGRTPVAAGETGNIVVILDQPIAGETPLWAMLHVDAGQQGTYEFPGVDAPVQVDGATVMAPFTASAPGGESALSDLVDTAASNDQFSTLVAALQAAGLVDALKGEGPYTVFAPTNDAFAALPEGTLDALLADPAGDLSQILLNHVVAGKLMAADVADGLEVDTLQGGTLRFAVDGDQVKVNDATIIATDTEASNGVIHVIDSVLLPGAEGEPEATPEPAEEAAEEATAVPTEEAVEEATPEPAEEATAEATEEPVEEATAVATEEPAEEPVEEATAEPAEEAAEEGAAAPGSKGAPATMPDTGAATTGTGRILLVVGGVLAALAGSVVIRRKP